MAIILENDALVFTANDVHPDARMRIVFQRTLRIPDNERDYPLPPGLGAFPLRHVDDCAERLPASWVKRGGVMLPMYQAEAMWLAFNGLGYPFALKIAAGKINAVTGDRWSLGLNRDPQDYAVVPEQPWLDGYAIEKGVVRQFVAMPLGRGYTAEEQITGTAEWGGLQIVAYPMKRARYEELQRERATWLKRMPMPAAPMAADFLAEAPGMGLAAGGRMRQEIHKDPYALEDWDQRAGLRCFIAILNSEDWQAVTGEASPTKPVSAKDYARAGLPWFEHYSDAPALAGAEKLARLKSWAEMARTRNEPIGASSTHGGADDVPITRVVRLGTAARAVLPGAF
jgi:hypothetical protein